MSSLIFKEICSTSKSIKIGGIQEDGVLNLNTVETKLIRANSGSKIIFESTQGDVEISGIDQKMHFEQARSTLFEFKTLSSTKSIYFDHNISSFYDLNLISNGGIFAYYDISTTAGDLNFDVNSAYLNVSDDVLISAQGDLFFTGYGIFGMGSTIFKSISGSTNITIPMEITSDLQIESNNSISVNKNITCGGSSILHHNKNCASNYFTTISSNSYINSPNVTIMGGSVDIEGYIKRTNNGKSKY